MIGIGNKGRNDDGLGWEFAEKIEQQQLPNTVCEYRYQLQIEDAHLIGQYETVFFVDASHQPIAKGFEITESKLVNHFYFSSHSQSPETILYLAKELFQKEPIAFTIAIAGGGGRVTASMNGAEVGSLSYGDDASVRRATNRSGRYARNEFTFPASALKAGENKVSTPV